MMSDLEKINMKELLAAIKDAEKARKELRTVLIKTIKLFNKELSKPKESHDDKLIDSYNQQIDKFTDLLYPEFNSGK
jgi:hypothetical protein